MLVNVVPVHAMETYRRSWGIAPFILFLSTWWMCMGSLKSRSLSLQWKNPGKLQTGEGVCGQRHVSLTLSLTRLQCPQVALWNIFSIKNQRPLNLLVYWKLQFLPHNKCKVTPWHAYAGTDRRHGYGSTLSLTSALEGNGRLMSRLALLIPGKDPLPFRQETALAFGLVWTGTENLAASGFDPQTVRSVASFYDDWAIAAAYTL